jgi:nicotinate-nucleotide adenylyltransferase
VIGILGGTFDPPHNGHVALAKAALSELPIEKLLVLVAEHPGHRGVVADPETRLRLARAAFPDAEVELDPHAFTVDTVRDGRFDNALFIVGADQGAAFERWKDPEEVLKHVKLAVGMRSGYPDPELSSHGNRVIPFESASREASLSPSSSQSPWRS